MKNMEYQVTRTFNIIAHGTHKGFPYWVISRGTHPCSYIEVTAIKDDIDPDTVECHGGVTYDEDCLHNVWDPAFDGFEDCKRRFIGWDYAHASDYYEYADAMMRQLNVHKWTTAELVAEVKETIDSLVATMKADAKR